MNKLFKFLKCQNIQSRLDNIKEGYTEISKMTDLSSIINNNFIIIDEIVYPDIVKCLDEKDVKLNFACNKQLIHAIAHIEYNANTIYTDTLLRFWDDSKYLNDELRLEFIKDVARIAYEESTHFEMLNNRLGELGSYYGEYPVIDKLWKNCSSTKDSLIERMAIISMVQESRGLDAGPKLEHKLKSLGDKKSADIISRIVRDEVSHVKNGIKWFKIFCDRYNYNYESKFKEVCKLHLKIYPPPPYNKALRDKADFPETWYNEKKNNNKV